MVWPQNLVACTLLNTLHAEDEDDGIGMYGGGGGGERGAKGMSRYRFFVIATVGSFVFFFLPGGCSFLSLWNSFVNGMNRVPV